MYPMAELSDVMDVPEVGSEVKTKCGNTYKILEYRYDAQIKEWFVFVENTRVGAVFYGSKFRWSIQSLLLDLA